MSRPRDDYLVKARAAWGNELPDWIEELAKEVTRKSQARVAGRIGYTTPVVSAVLANKYKGNLKRVEEIVRGALMGLTVNCPVVGEIGRDRCLNEQRMGMTGASSVRARLYRACRGGCEHSRLTEAEDAQS